MTEQRIDHMTYLPGMEVLDSNMLDEVTKYHDAFHDEDYTSQDVERALNKLRLVSTILATSQ